MDHEASAHDLLVDVLFDESKDPTSLPIGLLESITNHFSDDHIIGSGGFANVYKGQLRSAVVAVKKLKQQSGTDETKFIQEVKSLMKVKHKNVVRFLGYCSDTQGKMWKLGRENIMAEERQRFLCFEFLPEGSLDKHISDASSGLEWTTRYHIIKGICEGLHYVHGKNIVHSDLKPENILLDHNMVPKICDFGIARSFDEGQTRTITKNLVGTRPYMAPESYDGLITFKSDIYSLGIIITEMLTGQKYGLSLENVHENWNTRFKTSDGDTWLEHVRVCAEIGLECMEIDPMKRPQIGHIIDRLAELEHKYGLCETNRLVNQMFDVYPLHIWFLFESSDDAIQYPVSLINKSDYPIGVFITPTTLHACSNPDYPYMWMPDGIGERLNTSRHRLLRPHSTTIIHMTIRNKRQLPLQSDKGMFTVVAVVIKSLDDLTNLEHCWEDYDRTGRYEYPFTRTNVVHRATLRVGVTSDDPARCQEVAAHQVLQAETLERIRCTDVHPTETWLLVGYYPVSISIWNYETQVRIKWFEVTDLQEFKYGDREILSSGVATTQPPQVAGLAPRQTSEETLMYIKEKCYDFLGKCFLCNLSLDPPQILSIKFIAGEQWFAVGYDNGCVHLYNTSPGRKNMVTAFEAYVDKGVNHMDVQPEGTLLLTGSWEDKSIKLWDWSMGWTCARVINIGRLLFNNHIFASNDLTKVCDNHSSSCITTVEGARLAFYTDSTHRDILVNVPRYADYAEIWDLQTEKHIHNLYPSPRLMDCLLDLACHPTLPILAGIMPIFGFVHVLQIVLWHVRTFRVMKRFEVRVKGRYKTMVFYYRKDITSLVVTTEKEISIIKIDVLALLVGCATLI